MKLKLLLVALMFYSCLFGQTWETKESLLSNTVRHHPTTFAIDGVGYLMGGQNDLQGSLADFYSYDPFTDTWTVKTDFPGLSRGFSYAVNSETKGYVGFGIHSGTPNDEALADLWEYDPISDSWTELAPFPGTARWHPAMVYLEGKIFVGVGSSEIGNLGDWWEYDIVANEWTEKASFPGVNRHHPYYFGVDGFAYVGMGHGSGIFKDFYKYDLSDDAWTKLSDLPGEARVAGTQFAMNGKGYFLSGQGDDHRNFTKGEFWEYTPVTDSWEELNPHTGGGRWAPGSFVIDGWVYFMCGRTNTGDKKDMMAAQIINFASAEPAEDFIGINVYPNPSSDHVSFTNVLANSVLKITDLNGKVLLERLISSDDLIDVTTYDSGIYFYQLKTETFIHKGKFIKN